jgi:predicted exporter
MPCLTDSGTTSPVARLLAWLWLLAVLVIGGHTLWLTLGGHAAIDTDVLAMLPQNRRDPALQQVTQKLTDSGSRRIVVLAGGQDWKTARTAGDRFATVLTQSHARLQVSYRASDAQAETWLNFFSPYRRQLLTPGQREMLTGKSPQELAAQALSALYQPMGMPRIGSWSDDPLNLYGGWLTTMAGQSPVRVTEGRLSLTSGDRQYALLMLEQTGSAFSMSEQQALMPVLEQARQAASASAPGAEILVIGVPLYAAAAASQAEHEVDTIGLGSLCGIVILTLLAFSAIRPRILVTLSIAIGLMCAFSVTSLLFTRLHLITLVFGASLVGVAENYGTNYFSNRLGHPASDRWKILRQQAPSMWLAMLTTAIGYLLLALTPFPGLRQIAVFSAVGLLGSFLTVQCWFPLLDRGSLTFTRLAQWIGSRRAIWPPLGRNKSTLGLAIGISLILVCGTLRLEANDDIRLLQSAPDSLIRQQLRLNELLKLPSPTQFYLVQGQTPEQVLQREEALKGLLQAEVRQQHIAGYQAVSDWVPSRARQEQDAALIQKAEQGPEGVRAMVAAQLGEQLPGISLPPSVLKTLTIEQWLDSAVSEPLRHQWLGHFDGGYASVVLLRGAEGTQGMHQLAALAPRVPGVRWVDKVAEISGILGSTRHSMTWVILLSYALVFAALCLRFGRQGWRALAPTLLASLLALALLSLLGQAIQLFNVLALLLILGMGVDYGIFLLAQPSPQAQRPFLSVSLAAISTLLSFGLLALSSTPALRAFGLTMLFGITLSWLLMPFFLPHTPIESNHHAR